jgi:hypothetical protein
MRFVVLLSNGMFLAAAAHAATVTVPAGMKVFGELEQEVTSDLDEFSVGDTVRGRVWRNVVVDGSTVIEAGAPMTLRIAEIRKRKIAGRGGNVTIQAVAVTAVDGSEVFLEGGYDRQGSHRTGLTASLSALVFWPAIFIRGKEAVLEPGTVFDASVPANINIEVGAARPRTIRIASDETLSAEVLYDEVQEDAKELPLRLALCGADWQNVAAVTAVNDKQIPALSISLAAPEASDECSSARGVVDLKELSEHFTRGINRFTVESAGKTAEVVLDVEM